MENKIIVVLAIFMLSILFANVGVVFAQVFTTVSDMQERVRAISYQASTDSFWILSEGNGFTWLHQIDRATRSNIFSYNHTDTFDNLSAGVTQDIWCGQTSCYITTTGGLVVGITTETIAPNIFKGINVTGSYTHSSGLAHITGRDQVSGGFGSVTLWIDTLTGTSINVIIVDGISFTLTGTLPAYGTSGLDERVHDIRWSEVSGTIDNDLITSTGFITDTASQNSIVVYNLASLTIKCNVATPSQNNPLPVAPNYISAGDSNNKFYVGSINGIVYVYNENTCGVVQTFSTGLTGDLRFLDYDSGILFVQENGANAFIKQFAVNSTGFILSTNTTYAPLPTVAQNTFDSVETTLTNARFWLLAGNGQLWFPYTGNDEKIGILIYDEELQGEDGGGVSEFCQQPENFNILSCVLERGNTTPLVGASETIGNSTNTIVCQLGLIECTNFVPNNPDTKTNGVGYLILFVGLGIMIGIFWVASRGDLGSIPTFLWFIATLSIVGVITAFDLIDATILIVAIIAIIALATAKVKGIFGSSGLFAGDT